MDLSVLRRIELEENAMAVKAENVTGKISFGESSVAMSIKASEA